MKCANRLLLTAIILTFGTLGLRSAMSAEPPLTLKIMTASETSLNANSALIMGKTDAVLIDVPFTRSDGHRLIADILETGKNLKYIYITHDHPDHFLSLEVFAEAFPNARIVTAPEVVADIWRSLPFKLKRWGPMLGANGPIRPVVPTALETHSLELEGQELRLLGPMQGDHAHATAIFIPSINALIGGDIVFKNVHLWLGEHTPDQRKSWLTHIDELIAMHPAIVVAGHKRPSDPDDASALQFTRDYLVAFESALKSSKKSTDLIARMKSAFPLAQDYLGGFILNNSAQVAVGEAPIWTE
jgi:glyoxylase-like metal-dependent hydrolase (beta-lactamase superfamily II)